MTCILGLNFLTSLLTNKVWFTFHPYYCSVCSQVIVIQMTVRPYVRIAQKKEKKTLCEKKKLKLRCENVLEINFLFYKYKKE